MAMDGSPVMESKSGLAPAGRLLLILAGFFTAMLYILPAWATFRGAAQAIAQGYFYARSDFDTMWHAGFLIRAGAVATLYNRPLFDAWLQRQSGGGLADISWLYTPPMGLLAAAVSILPLRAAFWTWFAATALIAAILLRRAGLGWRVIAAGLAGPVAFYDFLLGQNGTLTGGLLVASLLMMETRPKLAGVLAGCLCIKPQIGILLPAVLARRRLILPAAACGLTVALLAAISGARGWWLFFHLAQPNADRILAIPFGETFQITCFTVFMAARSLHATLGAAWLAQLLASAAGFALVWLAWRRPDADNVARMALTVCCSSLAMPYGFSYDLVGFSIAMAALMPGAGPLRLAVLALLWLCPGYAGLLTARTGIVWFPAAALLGAALAAARLRRAPPGFDPAEAIS
jgi:hypothetical protein